MYLRSDNNDINYDNKFNTKWLDGAESFMSANVVDIGDLPYMSTNKRWQVNIGDLPCMSTNMRWQVNIGDLRACPPICGDRLTLVTCVSTNMRWQVNIGDLRVHQYAMTG